MLLLLLSDLSFVLGEGGVTRTFNRMRLHFYWRLMKDDLHQYINDCLSCRRRRIPKIKDWLFQYITSFGLWWLVRACNVLVVMSSGLTMSENINIITSQWWIIVQGTVSRGGENLCEFHVKENFAWFEYALVRTLGFPSALLADNATVLKSK